MHHTEDTIHFACSRAAVGLLAYLLVAIIIAAPFIF